MPNPYREPDVRLEPRGTKWITRRARLYIKYCYLTQSGLPWLRHLSRKSDSVHRIIGASGDWFFDLDKDLKKMTSDLEDQNRAVDSIIRNTRTQLRELVEYATKVIDRLPPEKR